MKNTVHFGFVAIIFIMSSLAFVWLGQIKNSNEKVLDLIEQFDKKIDYAHTMHNTIRVRQNLLLSMLVIDNSFEQDEKLQKILSYCFRISSCKECVTGFAHDGKRKAAP